MKRLGRKIDDEAFQPVLIDFYQQVGYLPQAILNYVLLLGWSLDDKTQFFSVDEMIEHFSLQRVNKSPASFDPQKLWAFQQHYMNALPTAQKVDGVLPYLVEIGWIAEPVSSETRAYVERVVEAAGDRIKTFGDVLDFPEFFVDDATLAYDEKAFGKRLGDAESIDRLQQFRDVLAEVEPFSAEQLERAMKTWAETQQIGLGKIIHPVRVATTGRGTGLGMFEALELLGKERTISRVDRALELARKRQTTSA